MAEHRDALPTSSRAARSTSGPGRAPRGRDDPRTFFPSGSPEPDGDT